MIPSEANELLRLISFYDNRKLDPERARQRAAAWAEVLAAVPLADAVAAVKHHFATSTEYLMPAHILQRVKLIRSERIDAFGAVDRMPGMERIARLVEPDGALRMDQRRVLHALVASGEVTAEMDPDTIAAVLARQPRQLEGGGRHE